MVVKNKVVRGTVYPSRNGDIEVLEYINNRKVKVKFLETGYISYKPLYSILKGTARDVYAPSIFGVGYLWCWVLWRGEV